MDVGEGEGGGLPDVRTEVCVVLIFLEWTRKVYLFDYGNLVWTFLVRLFVLHYLDFLEP